MKKNNKKGFTIVELVIVIAVIGILAAVLIPTFSSVITDANNKAALQNARNIYTEYLVVKDGTPESGNLYIKAEVNTKSYYFSVSNGKITPVANNTKPTDGKIITGVANDAPIYEQ